MSNDLVVLDQKQSLALPTIRETLQHVALVGEVLKHVMQDGIHYGAGFPGDTKKNLLKAGADSLGVAFQLAPTFEVLERDLGGDHREYRVTCTVSTQKSGMVVGTGVGMCSTKETKYRWRNAAYKCPACGAEALIQGKPEYAPKKDGKVDPDYAKGGWVCFDKKGGCKAKYMDEDPLILKQPRGKVENTDPADQWNTVLKMAKKRAFVDGMITATGCSDMFTQDLEDISADLKASAPVSAPAKPQEAPKAAEQPKAQSEAAKPQEAAQEAKAAPIEMDEAPDEAHLRTMFQMANTEDQVLEAWNLAYKHQTALGSQVMLKMKNERDKNLDRVRAK